MKPLLKVENLKLSFKSDEGMVPAVKGVDLQVFPGETLALVGESGCGKTALCRSLLRLHSGHAHIEEGRIMLNGSDVVSMTEKEMEGLRGRDVAMIFQDPMSSLNPVFSVGSQIMQPLILHMGLNRVQAKARGIELLELVGIDEPHLRFNQYPHHFSGGMHQRVAIAIALACDPKLIIADEPTTALDAETGKEIMSLLQNLCVGTERGMVFVTHDLGLAFDVADRIAVMQDGVIVESGDTEAILQKPQHPYTQKLMRFAQYGKGSHFHGDIAIGAKLSVVAPLVQVKSLTKKFPLGGKGEITVLEEFNLTINKGEIVGIIGDSGCGKSTLARCIMGIYPSDQGEILFDEGCKTQMIFQDSSSAFNPRMTIEQIIGEPLVIKHGVMDYDTVRQMMVQVELPLELAERHPYDVSGGQRQRAAIARALITNPDLVIADEPISSLDVSIQSQIIHLLKKIRDERGLTMLIIGHDVAMIEHVSDRVIKM